ncbi:MAG: MerR family transcriptional regulator [Bacillota bacterium]|nr:MerR family transcriptional regulator [Bacillota bacterium]
MKISEVMEVTGLTKKAINYYEQEGLLQPVENVDNNYREYSVDNVNRLIQISILRQLDIPVKEIKDILQNPDGLGRVLKAHIQRLDNDMYKLQRNRAVLEACVSELEGKSCTIPSITKKLSILNEALKMDEKCRQGYMKKQFLRIFPGNFGKVMLMNYGCFLNEPIDTPEKEEAWLALVQFLDETETILLPEEFVAGYESISEGALKDYETEYTEHIRNMISPSQEYLDKMEKIFDATLKKIRESEDAKLQFGKVRELKKTISGNLIGYDEKFTKNLRILSSDFNKYIENYNKLASILRNKFSVKELE